jgi:16S rRNA (uracil1498-N3)-methyltransferase
MGQTKLDRLRRIAREAAEQSGRARIPSVRAPIPLAQAVEEAGPHDLALLGTPEGQPIRRVLEQHVANAPEAVRLYIGPEGGFEGGEVRLAEERGVLPVHLGPRILRTETAGVALLAIVAYALGEMDGS